MIGHTHKQKECRFLYYSSIPVFRTQSGKMTSLPTRCALFRKEIQTQMAGEVTKGAALSLYRMLFVCLSFRVGL